VRYERAAGRGTESSASRRHRAARGAQVGVRQLPYAGACAGFRRPGRRPVASEQPAEMTPTPPRRRTPPRQ